MDFVAIPRTQSAFFNIVPIIYNVLFYRIFYSQSPIITPLNFNAFQQQQSSHHQSYSHSAAQPQPQTQSQPQPQQQQYIKPWSSTSSSSSFLDQQPYMTNALFYPQNSAPNTGATDFYLPRISNVPQQPYPGAAYPMMAAAMSAGPMYQPYYQPYFPTHRTSVSHELRL